MNPATMTLQDMFNTAYTVLQARGWTRALGAFDVECAYRGKNGPCAIGACIPDDMYSPTMEGRAADSHEISALFPLVNSLYLDRLQRCHDFGLTPNEMQSNFHEFATLCNLTIPIAK